MVERSTIQVQAATGGWPHPWPNVAEIADVLPSANWTLVGGLMTQLHTVNRGLGVVRPTNDIDIVLHIETARAVPAKAAAALEALGYRLLDTVDPRDNTAHRWVRDGHSIDVSGSQETSRAEHQVDVLTADHPAPAVVERMRGRHMIQIEGGTQALKRTINAVLEIHPDRPTTISVPRPFAAVILKAAAYVAGLAGSGTAFVRRGSPPVLHRGSVCRERQPRRVRPSANSKACRDVAR